jgi:phosphoribosylaminoimidazolecarboxamide formyltransferase / IMP cyclohydrolase
MDLRTVYERARDADARKPPSACVVAFNAKVDAPTADTIMESIVETVAAARIHSRPRNRSTIRPLQTQQSHPHRPDPKVRHPPKITSATRQRQFEIKVFDDGSVVLAQPYLSRQIRPDDLVPRLQRTPPSTAASTSRPQPNTTRQLDDLLFAWYVNIHVRSNGVVIAQKRPNPRRRHRRTRPRRRRRTSRRTKRKPNTRATKPSRAPSLASDGFFPFPDAIHRHQRHGIAAIVQPGGSRQRLRRHRRMQLHPNRHVILAGAVF